MSYNIFLHLFLHLASTQAEPKQSDAYDSTVVQLAQDAKGRASDRMLTPQVSKMHAFWISAILIV